MTWAVGDQRFANAGDIVVTDGRGRESDLVFFTFESLHAHLRGDAAEPLSEVLADLAGQSLTTPEGPGGRACPRRTPG